MSLEEEIAEWSVTRPAWQCEVIRRLASGEPVLDDVLRSIAAALVWGAAQKQKRIVAQELPGGAGSGSLVQLSSVRPVAHVNALQEGQTLSFASDGLTVVYGDNASGKSGFARLLKNVVRARDREDILTNVYRDGARELPEALISYEVDGISREIRWPNDLDPILRQVCFYDSACGSAYVTRESDVTYRPSGLALLDGLIAACDRLRTILDGMLSANRLAKRPLPTIDSGTEIGAFLARLGPGTTAAQLDAACKMPAAASDELLNLARKEAELRASNPTKERERLTGVATKLELVAAHLALLESNLGDAAAHALDEARSRASQLRAAADIASSTSFEAEPVVGIGTESWRALWDAARRFSEEEAYPGQPFPATDHEDRCVLCQQILPPDAAGRLRQFHAFMTDTTEQQASAAERVLKATTERVSRATTTPAPVTVALAAIEADFTALVDRCRAEIQWLEQRGVALLTPDDEVERALGDRPSSVSAELGAAALDQRTHADEIDDSEFQKQLLATTSRRSELEGRRAILAAREEVVGEISRLSERARIEAAKKWTDTAPITRKSTELARKHVTTRVRDQFTRESDRLHLKTVTLKDIGGRKGKLWHQPELLSAVQSAELQRVLSQGEQTALGLAGFLTEAHFDESRSSVVLDDPVTSLDHWRRSYIAKRLTELATERQVIVFTHDLSFIVELQLAADELAVPLTERSVERRSDESIGVCVDHHPWKAKDAKSRLHELEAQLGGIKRDSSIWEPEKYTREVAVWAGSLSETWERIIGLELVNHVFDRGRSEVKPMGFRVLSRITDEDNRQFQASYRRVSGWLLRHDKSPETNPVVPSVAELEAELQVAKDFYARIRRYATT